MNQANQKVVIQNANINLIHIRTFELNYFSNFFSNFGTQSALMIGFIAGSISQVPGYDDPTDAGLFWALEYWISSSLCVGCAIACLVSAFFILVFGQGLAIRGKEGSMIQTIDGMIIEQRYIVLLFCLTLFFFGLQCMGMYYLMFDPLSALITTIITALAMIQGYREAIRLYNRFYCGDLTTMFEEKDEEDELNDLDPSLVTDLMSKKKRTVKKKSIHDYSTTPEKKKNEDGDAAGQKKETKNPLVSSPMLSRSNTVNEEHNQPTNDDTEDRESIHSNTSSGRYSASFQEIPSSLSNATLFASYLTVKDRINANTNKEEWKRRYFLLKRHLLYYYQDKRRFDLEPSKPINRRGIDLEGYSLLVTSDLTSNTPLFFLSLVPYDNDDIRKIWKFRCDTSTEFDRWTQLLSVALVEANPNKHISQLVLRNNGKGGEISSSSRDVSEYEDEGAN
jgi:hypothetical protein